MNTIISYVLFTELWWLVSINFHRINRFRFSCIRSPDFEGTNTLWVLFQRNWLYRQCDRFARWIIIYEKTLRLDSLKSHQFSIITTQNITTMGSYTIMMINGRTENKSERSRLSENTYLLIPIFMFTLQTNRKYRVS